MRSLFALVATFVMTGCFVETSGGVYATAQQPTVVASGNTNPTVVVGQQPTVVQPTATVVQPTVVQPAPVQCVCRQGAVERCNHCDDNCNGAVDEDCVP